MTENCKKSNGGKKFMLGALLGGAIGTIAGKFFKTNEKEIKEGVSKKVDEIKSKIGDVLKDEDGDGEPDIKEKVEEKVKEVKEKIAKKK